MSPTPKPGILEITPYVGGRATAPGAAKVHKRSSNESPLGPSPAALAALDQARASLALYPEGSAALLRDAIAEVEGLDASRIVAWTDGQHDLTVEKLIADHAGQQPQRCGRKGRMILLTSGTTGTPKGANQTGGNAESARSRRFWTARRGGPRKTS